MQTQQSNGGGGVCRTPSDAFRPPMPNSRTTRGTSLPPPSLGISQGAPPSRRGGKEAEEEEEEEEEAPLAPPAGCRDASRRAAAASRPLGAPLPLSADASPPVCLLYASPVCLLFASWLSHRPCCRAAAASASRLCLDLFFAIWLSQLATPHLSRRRRLSFSSRLCLATRRLRLSTRHRLITGCVVARR
jgi:hypothetical protein